MGSSYHYPGVSNNLALPPATMEKIAEHPNVVGCKLSHGALDDHALVALSPAIDHNRFQTFSGLGQQLLPLLTIGGAGVIDGLAGVFPKTVVRLYDLYRQHEEKGAGKKEMDEMRALQYQICKGEKLIGKWGAIGAKEAISRVLGYGSKDGGRLPVAGGFGGDSPEWEAWKGVYAELQKLEQSLP